MKIPYFCCIGAELKRYSQDFDFMNQVYLYKVPTDDSIDEVLSEDYFKDVSSSVLQDDIIFIYEASAKKLHECRFDKQNGHITAVPLEFDEFVKKTGDTMSGDLVFQYSMSYPALHIMQSEQNTSILRFFKFGSSAGQSISFDLSQAAIHPLVTGIGHLGTNAIHFGDAHIDKVYTGFINNGYDIAVPVTNSADTLALKSEVDLAANSGDQLTEKGVWYAKMYSATVAPSAEDGTNYADFSQTDGQGNPIIVIYKRQNGAWVQDQTITPPAEYNGYVPVTSKIWDIVEQAGQQGGKILWSHNQKTFTPSPLIISFEDIEITGTSTVIMPNNPGANQIVNKGYVDNVISSGGTGRNVGDVFYTMRNDSELNGAVECDGTQYNTTDFTGEQSIGALLESGKIPYVSLSVYATALATNGSVGVFGWDGANTTAFRVPSLNDIFIETGTAAQIGDYIAPAVPNITGKLASYAIQGTGASGAFYATDTVGSSAYDSSNHSRQASNAVLDASRSSSVYKNGTTTVQPNAVRYRAMVQLAVSASDEAVETCTGVLADVAGLKDASNLTTTGKLNIINMMMPDYANGISIATTNVSYTAPSAGWFAVQTSRPDISAAIFVNGVAVFQDGLPNQSGAGIGHIVPVSQGDVITWSSGIYGAVFFPCKGA